MKISRSIFIQILGSLIYELFALIPIWMVSGFIFIIIFDGLFGTYQRLLFQIYLWLISGFYFTYCWTVTGQTLAMKAWKIKLLSNKRNLTLSKARLRYIFATIGLGLRG